MASAGRPELGICQWFHYEDYRSVEKAVERLRELGVRHLRTGISWADYHRPGGREWYDWQMGQLSQFEVLLSIWHTPPSIAEGSTCAGPPKRLSDYAGFIHQVIDQYGSHFQWLELWNEPNNRLKWNFPQFDPQWRKFGKMVQMAAEVAHRQQVGTVLGGMIPVDPSWLELMQDYGALEHIDVVAIHGFPQMWWADYPNWDWYHHWHGWQQKIEPIAAVAQRPIWITETGLATWDLDANCEARFELQVQMLEQAVQAPAERVYWYSLIDLDPQRDAIEGFHVDENEYHMGLVTFDGEPKPAFFRLQQMLRQRSATGSSSAAPSSGEVSSRRSS